MVNYSGMSSAALDEALATRLFHWYKAERRVINGHDCGPGWWNRAFGDPLEPAPGAVAASRPPGYSTTYEGMGCVIETMKKHDDGFDCTIDIKDYAHVLFSGADGSDEEWRSRTGPNWAMDPYLPRAVAVAALRATHKTEVRG